MRACRRPNCEIHIMIRLAEASNFRSLKCISQTAESPSGFGGLQHHGKSTFLEVGHFLGDLLVEGLAFAVDKRMQKLVRPHLRRKRKLHRVGNRSALDGTYQEAFHPRQASSIVRSDSIRNQAVAPRTAPDAGRTRQTRALARQKKLSDTRHSRIYFLPTCCLPMFSTKRHPSKLVKPYSAKVTAAKLTFNPKKSRK